MAVYVRDHRGGNWWWAHNDIIDHYGAALGAYGIAVYVCLCRHAGQDQSTWVGQKRIAEEIGASRVQVNRVIAKLRELRLIDVEEQQDERGRLTNVYTLLAPAATETQHPRIPDIQGSIPQIQPLYTEDTTTSLPDTAMNKTQLTKLMEQGASPALRTRWHAAADSLAQEMTAANFQQWIAPLELVELANSHAVLHAPTPAIASYVGTRLADKVAGALGVERVEVRTPEEAR